ncbi:MAG: FAD-dependent oxidoreductase [Candidatus Eremiobacterota bacterium]
MMNTAKITINGQEIITENNKTILEVIMEHNIDDIPHLCYDPKLPPYGSCYLCVVEVEGLGKLVPSCCNPVNNGMVIHTNNERIRASRKMALEFLLSNHYADCIGPCKNTCPAGVDIQGYVGLMSMGKYREAVRLIKKNNPLPLVCGRVCVRECEVACRRNKVDEPLGIDYLKRYASDIDMEDPWIPDVPEKNGKKIAVVGGGPSGLTCAYYLILKGYDVTIFEKHDRPGGMLLWGIPEYRLPKKILAREIKWITDLGVKVNTGTSIGKDFTIDSLFKEGFNSIYLALGAQGANKMRVPEEDITKEVISGIDFLYNSQFPGKVSIYGTVAVVGGGNTAIDAARTALRYGAKKVIILYRRTRQEMPANNMEIEAAIHEGVETIFLSAPVKLVKEEGRLTGIECIKMALGEPDRSGRRRPVPVSGSEYILHCDFVISAIGQQVELDGLEKDERLNVTKHNTVSVNINTLETSIPGVFSGGDVATGPAVAIDAIAHGKMAAESIDEFLKTGNITPVKKEFFSSKDIFGDIPESEFAEYEKIKREIMPELPPEERIKHFEEVELGYSNEQAEHEAHRCLTCGCSALFECKLKEYATEYDIDVSRFIGEVRKYKLDSRHPFIKLDPNKCISCGRCVRTCAQILNVSALGFVYRGFKSVVKPAMEKELLETGCISCGNCISACPTGAITENYAFKKPGPWITEKVPSICSFCSSGCNLIVDALTEDIFSIENGGDGTHNRGYLCAKGKFGYRYLFDKGRLLKPMVRNNGTLSESDWNEALDITAGKIKHIIDTYGPEAVAVFGSPKMSNEELYLLQKFARAGLKTNNVHTFSEMLHGTEPDSIDSSFDITASTATTDVLATSDVIIVINSDLTDENLIMELKIKEALKKGAKLVVINSCDIHLTKFADLWLDSRRGTNTVLLNGIMNELIEKGNVDKECIKRENFEIFKDSVSQFNLDYSSQITGVDKNKLLTMCDLMVSKNITVIYNIDSHKEKAVGDFKAIWNLLMLSGRIGKERHLITVRNYCNSAGLMNMGFMPYYLPGCVKYGEREKIDNLSKRWNLNLQEIFKPVDVQKKMKNNEIKAALVFGENPLCEVKNIEYFRGLEFLMVHDYFMTETAGKADVILPYSAYIETEGTFTACDGRVQKFNKIFNSKTGLENWQVIKKLAAKLNIDLEHSSTEDIFNEIKESNTLHNKENVVSYKVDEFFIYDIDTHLFNLPECEYMSDENYFRINIKNRIIKNVSE